MIGRVTRHMLPHLSGVPQLHVNRPLARAESEALVDIYSFLKQRKKNHETLFCNGKVNDKKDK